MGLTLNEYYDKTLLELSTEIAGYNRRWEENIKSNVRPLYTLFYNAHFTGKNRRPKKDYELMPLPSDAKKIRLTNAVERARQQVAAELGK